MGEIFTIQLLRKSRGETNEFKYKARFKLNPRYLKTFNPGGLNLNSGGLKLNSFKSNRDLK